MSAVWSLFLIVLPVFLVVGGGYVAARANVMSDAAIDGLIRYATNIAIPVLLFRAILDLDLASALKPGLLASFYAGALVSFLVAIVVSRRVFGRRPGESVAVAFCALFSNSVLLGLPIFTRAYGEQALVPVYAIIAFHAPFCYLVGITTMELSRRDGADWREIVKRTANGMFRNALTIGIMLGFAANLTGITVPDPVHSSIDIVAGSALPVALFALGGVLTRYRVLSSIAEAGSMAGFSLLLHPLVAYVLSAWVFRLPPEYVRAAVLIGAMPTGINGYVFSAMYDRAVGTAASVVLLATAASVVTVTFWLAILGGGGLG